MGGKSVQAPTPRNYLGEMQGALNAQAGIQSQLLGLQGQYMPQYQQQMQTGMQGQLGVTNNLFGTAIGQSAGLQQQQYNANAGLYNQIGAGSANAYNQLLGPQSASLMASQTNAANQALAQGSNLSPQAQQAAQQSARAAMAFRGLNYSNNQGIAQEVFNNYALGQQQLASNRAYAGQVAGQNLQQANSAYSSFGQPQIASMQGLNASNLLGQSYSMYQNPTAGMLFNPESQYNSQIISANQQNAMQAQIANAQANSGLLSGIMSMTGQMGGGLLGNQGLFGATKTPTTAASAAGATSAAGGDMAATSIASDAFGMSAADAGASGLADLGWLSFL